MIRWRAIPRFLQTPPANRPPSDMASSTKPSEARDLEDSPIDKPGDNEPEKAFLVAGPDNNNSRLELRDQVRGFF